MPQANLEFFPTQVGDGSNTARLTPVAVVGLSSDVAMVALSGVRLTVIAIMRALLREQMC
jgi:hypothetical protein